jgi:hypothetical protein
MRYAAVTARRTIPCVLADLGVVILQGTTVASVTTNV